MPEPAYSAPLFTGGDTERAVNAAAKPPAPGACRVALTATAHGERTALTLQGELDLDTGAHVEPGLRAALDQCVTGMDLYLDAVRFCDCSGLNILLRLRGHAADQGKSVVLCSSSRSVDRILELTGTRRLFDAPAPGGGQEVARASPPGQDPPPDGGVRELRAEVAHLRRAMRTRPVIDLARGILMATFALSPEAAWAVLVTTSQNTNTKLHRLAQDLIDSLQGAALPEALQRQLQAAITTNTSAPATPAASPGCPACLPSAPPRPASRARDREPALARSGREAFWAVAMWRGTCACAERKPSARRYGPVRCRTCSRRSWRS
ncbi:anti-sigma factor antagonist [Streptomyces sp. Ac-502]|uniref:anti-sigma factor antagonist n=1 Tax=Streptomyces sp. Ac-502 TaxID=3342801 RepID=UPI003862B78C